MQFTGREHCGDGWSRLLPLRPGGGIGQRCFGIGALLSIFLAFAADRAFVVPSPEVKPSWAAEHLQWQARPSPIARRASRSAAVIAFDPARLRHLLLVGSFASTGRSIRRADRRDFPLYLAVACAARPSPPCGLGLAR